MKINQNHSSDKHHLDGGRCSTHAANDDIDAKNGKGQHNNQYSQNKNQKKNNKPHSVTSHYRDFHHSQQRANSNSSMQPHTIPQRLFMDTLLKHTAIALAIIIPLAIYSAFATYPSITTENDLFAPLEVVEEESGDQVNNETGKPTTNDSQYMHILGVPVYDEEIFTVNEELQYTDLNSNRADTVSAEDAPISARNN